MGKMVFALGRIAGKLGTGSGQLGNAVRELGEDAAAMGKILRNELAASKAVRFGTKKNW